MFYGQRCSVYKSRPTAPTNHSHHHNHSPLKQQQLQIIYQTDKEEPAVIMCHTELVVYKQCGHTVREFKLCPNQDPRYSKEAIYLEPCGFAVLTDISRQSQCPRCTTEVSPVSNVHTNRYDLNHDRHEDNENEAPHVLQPFKKVDYQRSSPVTEELFSPRSASSDDSDSMISRHRQDSPLAAHAPFPQDNPRTDNCYLDKAAAAYREEYRTRGEAPNWRIVTNRPSATGSQRQLDEELDPIQHKLHLEDPISRRQEYRPDHSQQFPRSEHDLKQRYFPWERDTLPKDQYYPWSTCSDGYSKSYLGFPSDRYALPTGLPFGSKRSNTWHMTDPRAWEDTLLAINPAAQADFRPGARFTAFPNGENLNAGPRCKEGTRRPLFREEGDDVRNRFCWYHRHRFQNPTIQDARRRRRCGSLRVVNRGPPDGLGMGAGNAGDNGMNERNADGNRRDLGGIQ